MPSLRILLTQLGESDCEAIGDGILKQPVNAWTSLSFSVVGLLIVFSATRVEGPERLIRITFGALLVATGIGSFLFHGPQTTGSHFIHDITFLAALWFLAVMNLNEAYAWWPGTGWIAFAVGLGILALVLVLFPDATNALTGVTLVAVVVGDLALQRRGGFIGGWYGVALGAMAIAVGFLVLGRSGSPLCDPASALQGHGGWHLFAAIALGAYFLATSRARIEGRRSLPVAR